MKNTLVESRNALVAEISRLKADLALAQSQRDDARLALQEVQSAPTDRGGLADLLTEAVEHICNHARKETFAAFRRAVVNPAEKEIVFSAFLDEARNNPHLFRNGLLALLMPALKEGAKYFAETVDFEKIWRDKTQLHHPQLVNWPESAISECDRQKHTAELQEKHSLAVGLVEKLQSDIAKLTITPETV